ncbi:MAG: hypothetical protein ACLP0J_05490 [Solirubrobacteraceae bacterium]
MLRMARGIARGMGAHAVWLGADTGNVLRMLCIARSGLKRSNRLRDRQA